MTQRILLVRGAATAHRLLLPAFGRVTIGSGPQDDVEVLEPGVRPGHLVLQVDYGIEATLAEGEASCDRAGTRLSLEVGEGFEMNLDDRLAFGGVELVLVEAAPAPAPVPYPGTPEELTSSLLSAQVAAVGALRLRGAGDPEPDLLAAWPSRAPIARLDDATWALAAIDEDAAELQTWLSEALRALEAVGFAAETGVATTRDTAVTALLERARARIGTAPVDPAAASEPDEGPSKSSVAAASTQPQMSLREEMAALERRRILEALDAHGSQQDAAKALGIPVRTFANRMDALGIPRRRAGKTKDED